MSQMKSVPKHIWSYYNFHFLETQIRWIIWCQARLLYIFMLNCWQKMNELPLSWDTNQMNYLLPNITCCCTCSCYTVGKRWLKRSCRLTSHFVWQLAKDAHETLALLKWLLLNMLWRHWVFLSNTGGSKKREMYMMTQKVGRFKHKGQMKMWIIWGTQIKDCASDSRRKWKWIEKQHDRF